MIDLQGGKSAVSKDYLKKIESDLKIQIPLEVVDFYLKYNGGYCEKNTFFIDGDGYKINEFLPFGGVGDCIESTYREVFLENDEMPDNLVPFASDSGGDYFCFESSGKNVGRIVFFESEYYDDPDQAVVVLSASFSEFIEQLEIDK